MTIKQFVFLCLLSSISITQAQDLKKIKVKEWMCCDLHSVLSEISEKYDVQFDYDSAYFKTINYQVPPIGKRLDILLDKVCEANTLKYYLRRSDSTYHIVDKFYRVDQEEVKEIKVYKGNSTRRKVTISGKVVEKGTSEVLPFVSIMAKGATTGTTTNVDGFFTLLNVPTDTSTIVFSYIGYHKKKLFLSPESNFQDIKIIMEPEEQNLEEVIVTADKQDILQVSTSQTSMIKMSPKKLNALPNLGEQDILRSFQLMPGISAANESSSGLYVRGGTPDQVLVTYDGFTVYNVEHMFGFFSAFNSNAIKDVQLYKGGYDARYGGRLASVVEITGKDGNKNEFNAAADISLMSVNGFLEFPLGKKVTAIVAGRRSWESPLYTKIFDQFASDSNEDPGGGIGRPGGRGAESDQETSSYFYDVNAKVTYTPNSREVLSLSLYNGKDDLDNSLSPSSSGMGPMNLSLETIDKTSWGNSGASLKWSRKFNDRLYGNTLLSYSNYFSNRERSTDGNFTLDEDVNSISRGVLEDNNLIDFGGKADFEYMLSKHQKLGFGLQFIHNEIDYSYTQNDTIAVIDRESDGNTYAAYLEDKFTLANNNLFITPGLRSTYFTGTSKYYFEPRINITYNLTDRLKLKAASGKYYQYAKRVIREDITQGSRDFWALSDDENLPVSSSEHYIAGLTYETPNFLFDVEGYYKNLDNVTEYSLRVTEKREGVDYGESFYTGTGMARGIDFLIQKKHGKLTGWVGYTLGQVTNRIEEFGDYDFYAAHDVTHEFKTVLTYKWRNWDLGANWIFASGQPYTSPEGTYDLTLLDGSTAEYINVSVKNGNRLPDYHRLDVSANLNFKLGKSPARLGLSLFNVYNRSNLWYKEYEIIENDVIETPVYYLGLTPNISLSIKLK